MTDPHLWPDMNFVDSWRLVCAAVFLDNGFIFWFQAAYQLFV